MAHDTFLSLTEESELFRANMRFLARHPLEPILKYIEAKETLMAQTIQDENDALSAEETTVAALVADVSDEMSKFEAAIAAGTDTAPFVSRINAINSTLKGLDQSALAATGTLPVALPPASPEAPVAGS